MSNRKIINPKTYIENMEVSGGESYIAGRDIHRYGDSNGMSMKDFQNLLTQSMQELRSINLLASEREAIQANINLAKAQSHKAEPKKSLIVGPLTTAFDLIVQAAGAATATETIVKLLQKAITFAEKMF